jgi:hypothetical protein
MEQESMLAGPFNSTMVRVMRDAAAAGESVGAIDPQRRSGFPGADRPR